MKQVKDYIRDLDEIYTPSAQNLHFQTDKKQKTFCGGFLSLAVTIYVIFFVYSNGKKMVTRDDAQMTSLYQGMVYEEVGKVGIQKVAKILYEMLERGDNTIDLDAIEGGYRQYIHIRLVNAIKTWNPDKNDFDLKSNFYYPVKCQESNFAHTEFEKQYYMLKKNRNQYCIDQFDEVYLQGTRDSEILKQDHAYIILETYRCSEKTAIEGDPPCKPKKLMVLKDGTSTEPVAIEKLIADGSDLDLYQEDMEADSIDNFTRNKKVGGKIINQKIDFTTFNDYAVRYNELYIPSIDMRYPSYSDTGYRFRYNIFDRADGYAYPINKDNVFFDYFNYNGDTFQGAPEGLEHLIVEQYFRLEVDQTSHGRQVYNLMDFIGDLGGVQGIMLQIAGWLIGSYSAFHASYATAKALYKIKTKEELFQSAKCQDQDNLDLQKMKLPTKTRIFLWTQTTIFAFFCKCCRNPKDERYLEILEKAGERVEADFDIYEMIQEQKLMRHQIDRLIAKQGLEGDPIFEQVDQKAVIDMTEEAGDQTPAIITYDNQVRPEAQFIKTDQESLKGEDDQAKGTEEVPN